MKNRELKGAPIPLAYYGRHHLPQVRTTHLLESQCREVPALLYSPDTPRWSFYPVGQIASPSPPPRTSAYSSLASLAPLPLPLGYWVSTPLFLGRKRNS